MRKLTYENIDKRCIRVNLDNHRIGEFIMAEDGYFLFFFDKPPTGGFEGWLFFELANELEKINKPWDKIVQDNQQGSLSPHIVDPSVEACDKKWKDASGAGSFRFRSRE